MSLRQLLRQHKVSFMIYLLGVLLTTPTNLMISLAIAKPFDLFYVKQSGDVIRIMVVTLFLALAPVFMQLLSRYLRIGFMRDIVLDVRMMAYDRLLRMDTKTFTSTSSEKFQAQLTSDIQLFEQDFFLSLLNICFSIGSFILGISVLFYLSFPLALMTLLVSLLMLILSSFFKSKSLTVQRNVLTANTTYHQSLSNLIKGLIPIKLFQVEHKFERSFEHDIDDLEREKYHKYRLQYLQEDFNGWVSGTYQILAYLYAAYLLSQGLLTFGQLLIVSNLLGQLIWTMNSGFSFINRYRVSKETFESITHYEQKESSLNLFTFDKELRVESLAYQYGDLKVLDKISFRLEAGEKMLLTGESGSGKSTLIKLLTKSLTLQDGSVHYDCVPIDAMDESTLWDQVLWVRQEHFLFDASILDNIILNQEYDDMRFQNVLNSLDLSSWIDGLEEKEYTLLKNNASQISGGQRQRLSLARALYQDKSLYIFDEPSASLDDETAMLVYESILSLDASVICISHRHVDYLSKRFDQCLDLGKEHEDV